MGDTHACADAEYDTVAAAVAAATAGDLVTIAADTATWTTKLLVNKGITIQGAGGANTVITNGGTGGTWDELIQYEPADYTLNGTFRLTAVGLDANGHRCLVLGGGDKTAPFTLQTKVRVDHCAFTNSGGVDPSGQGIYNWSGFYGVIDNNTFAGMGYPICNNPGVGGDDWWDNSPQNIFSWGSPYYLYYEDNTFTLVTLGTDNMLANGACSTRYVFRYNTIDNTAAPTSGLFEQHGQQGNLSTSMAACFGAELYGNQVSHAARAMGFWKQRSGQSLVFLNNFTGSAIPYLNAYTSGECVAPTDKPELKYTHNSYWFGSRANLTGALVAGTCDGGLTVAGFEDVPTLGRDVHTDGSTPGITMGPLASLPGTCAVGQGYWATAQATDDLTGLVGVAPATPIAGTLYRCDTTNVWTEVYTPYTYPHPLRGEAGVKYRVLYYGNGSTTGAAPVDATEYDATDVATIEAKGTMDRESYYAFVGWNTQADGLGTSYAPGATMTMPAADVTLYAQWQLKCFI